MTNCRLGMWSCQVNYCPYLRPYQRLSFSRRHKSRQPRLQVGMADSTSRLNGAQSKGPITPEGKIRSSQNSLRHGLCSKEVVLPHEDRSQFEALRDSYMDRFQPADQPEADLVETLASARWRLNRVPGIENKIFEEEMGRHGKVAHKEFCELDEPEMLAWTFDHMANHSKSLQLLIRYEGNLNRTYERALKQLQTLQSTRPPAQAPAQRNEPRLVEIDPPSEPETASEPPEIAPPAAIEAAEPPNPAENQEDSAL